MVDVRQQNEFASGHVAGAANIELAADLIERHDVEFFCLVDSPAGARQLADVMRARGATLNVLLEIAPTRDQAGFRTGALYVGYWWWVLPPGILIVFTALAFMLLALALEPIVDPRLRRG